MFRAENMIKLLRNTINDFQNEDGNDTDIDDFTPPDDTRRPIELEINSFLEHFESILGTNIIIALKSMCRSVFDGPFPQVDVDILKKEAQEALAVLNNFENYPHIMHQIEQFSKLKIRKLF